MLLITTLAPPKFFRLRPENTWASLTASRWHLKHGEHYKQPKYLCIL